MAKGYVPQRRCSDAASWLMHQGKYDVINVDAHIKLLGLRDVLNNRLTAMTRDKVRVLL